MANKDQVDKWKKFANCIKEKRLKKPSANIGGKRNKDAKAEPTGLSYIIHKKEITVQPLATEATGKAQKYDRTGAQEFVNFPHEEVTIPNIIDACNKHFKSQNQLKKGMTCDVLAGERGPSCTRLEQLPNMKLIHIRFIRKDMYNSISECSYTASQSTAHFPGTSIALSAAASKTTYNTNDVARSLSIIPHLKRKATELSGIPNLKRKKEHAHSLQPCPRSLSVTAMMKLGTAISTAAPPPVSIEVSQFDMEQLRWSAPVLAYFDIEKTEFARGGFRAAVKATSKSPPFRGGTTYIVKFYHPGTLRAISAVNDSTEDHARKSVQMHVLAKNFADQITVQVAKEQKQEVFGKTFSYVDVFLGKIEGTGEIVTI